MADIDGHDWFRQRVVSDDFSDACRRAGISARATLPPGTRIVFAGDVTWTMAEYETLCAEAAANGFTIHVEGTLRIKRHVAFTPELADSMPTSALLELMYRPEVALRVAIELTASGERVRNSEVTARWRVIPDLTHDDRVAMVLEVYDVAKAAIDRRLPIPQAPKAP